MNLPGQPARRTLSLALMALASTASPVAIVSGALGQPVAVPGRIEPGATPADRPVPLVPTVPAAVSRPESWPGAPAGDRHVLSSIRERPGSPLVAAASTATGQADPSADEGVIPAGYRSSAAMVEESIDVAQVVARVGTEVVLEADLLTPSAMAWLEKVSPGLKPEQIRQLKLQICRQVLPQHVESLLIYVDALRTIPEDRLPEIEAKVNEAFDEQQLPKLVRDAGVATVQEYEQQLRRRSLSLDRIRKTFFERALAQQWMQQRVQADEDVPHAEMIAWYHDHLAEYDFPARARYEQCTVRVGRGRSREEAWNRLAKMGNDILEGRSFAEVARAGSEGPLARDGGRSDWTTRGSLVSKALDEAIFTLPVGQLSTIIEDDSGLHIVRVVERAEAGRTPFIDAQVEIRDRLISERRGREVADYLAKVRERTPVWTIFDTDEGGEGSAARSPTALQR
ncbi:MAG: hypothetical protein FJ309_05170 [Planctomycetes bacterium]|nr:hypothetical protein [Planctomycetota bacterium]MBM4057807.1 hypothetical protein [Planctomycetota bacterium]